MWMDEEIHEHAFTCPYCWETITMLLDTTLRSQSYVEDCEVCCNPIQLHYEHSIDGFLIHFEARPLNG